MDMQEIHNAALAYYHNLSDELKQKASEKFKEMDSNDNGTISIKEFRRSLGSSEIKRCFKLLDKTGDGKLDFNEFITLYYLVESGRGVFCDGHGCKASPFLNGLYFTCVECFHNNEAATFDLCTSCYRDGKYVHNHASFLDNYVFLRSKAACESTTPTEDDHHEVSAAESAQPISRGLQTVSDLFGRSGPSEMPSSPKSDSESDSEFNAESNQVSQSGSKRRAVFEAIKSLNSQVSIGDAAADESGSCSIM
ncbi:uncharacterized protein LOC112199748 [Rosa chinensis]|uniref:uncharacterized protein LOC112199748 n=1 Tax=Rosa chinensis TaxID=74649 RepID=UPI000D08C78D|nr:uncharacterized protein LOC112199748 [Rosa chinensis]